jgi:hypothetical protein
VCSAVWKYIVLHWFPLMILVEHLHSLMYNLCKYCVQVLFTLWIDLNVQNVMCRSYTRRMIELTNHMQSHSVWLSTAPKLKKCVTCPRSISKNQTLNLEAHQCRIQGEGVKAESLGGISIQLTSNQMMGDRRDRRTKTTRLRLNSGLRYYKKFPQDSQP